MDAGRLSPYKNNAGSAPKRLFDASNAAYPQIGKRISSVDASKIPDLEELQELCLRDVQATRVDYADGTAYFAPSGLSQGGNPNDTDYTIDLIKRLKDVDADLERQLNGVAFQGYELEELCEYGYEEPYNNLKTCTTNGVVLPRHFLQYLSHSDEGTTTITLLAGSLVWVVWPPTDHNLSVLKTVYETFFSDFIAGNYQVLEQLEGGIIFIQEKGEGLRLPPFCPILNLPLQTAVLASYSDLTVENFLSMLPKIPLMDAWYKTELSGETKHSAFNASLLKFMDHLLNGTLDPETGEVDDTHKLELNEEGLLDQLLNTWETSKKGIADMLGSNDAQVLANIWSDFLIKSKGRECKICKKRINNKSKQMLKHFQEHHWVTK